MSQIFADPDFEPLEGLESGTCLLNGQYEIKSLLQKGGFGIAYVAHDSLDREVVIKECFVSELCVRIDGKVRAVSRDADLQFSAIKRQFAREARQVAQLDHPNIISVHQVFEENNTAYMALDQVGGEDLISVSDESPERLTNAFLRTILDQTLDAIGHVHEHAILHRDISPDNILVDANDHVTLIDFGAAQEQRGNASGTAPMIIAVKDGFSPPELYAQDGLHDLSSDLYALGATMYYLITGSPPPSSHQRYSAITKGAADPYVPLDGGDWDIDRNILTSTDHALEILQKNRFRSASEWKSCLEQMPVTSPEKVPAADADPGLEATIAQLVEKTNTQLGTGRPAGMSFAKIAGRRFDVPAPVAPKDRTLVDIFGNPIDDIAAWQAEQERADRHSQILDDPVEETRTQTVEPARKSLLSSLLSRCLPMRKEALASQEYS